MRITPWYSGTVKPVRIGVYQRRYGRKVFTYCYWDGQAFSAGHVKIEKSMDIDCISIYQKLEWRGIKK